VLADRGYEPYELGIACLERFVSRRCPGWPFVAPDRPEVDLHWHALHDSCQVDADADFWASAVPLDLDGVVVKALNATDQLLHVCVHALQPTRRGNLRWVTDAVGIVRHGVIDWPRFLDQASRRRLVPQVRRALGYLRANFADTVPERVWRALVRARVSWLERAEFGAQLEPHRRLGALAAAVLAYQAEVRWGRRPAGGFRRFAPAYLYGAAHWRHVPRLWLANRLGREAPLARGSLALDDEGHAHAPLPYALGRELRFGRDGDGLGALGGGWSYAERGGVWSDEALSRVDLELAEPADRDLVLTADFAGAMVSDRRPTLGVDVFVNATRVARWGFAAPLEQRARRSASIPRSALDNTRCRIVFRIDSPRAPAVLGINEDERRLGVHLCALRLDARDSATKIVA